jgi:hypothetical protein
MGLLLCIGDDGHFDVEAPHEGRDCHADDEGSAKSEGCRDIELSVAQVAESPRVPISAAPSVLLVTTRPPPAPLSPSAEPPLDSPSFDSCTRTALRSIVLLV